MEIIDDLSLSQVEVTVPTTSTFLYFFIYRTFVFSVNVHLGFEINFFRVNKLINSIEIEIVSNNRAVPCMGLGSRFHLPFGDQQLFFNYSCNQE